MVVCTKTIQQCLHADGRVLTADPQMSVAAAAKKMHDHRVGCLMVIDEQGRIVGIISERDIVARVVAKGQDPADVCVREAMTHSVHSVGRSTTVDEAGRRMAQTGVRHLPIIEGGVPLGMISSRDVLTHQLANANAKARKGRRILQELENEHPGITKLDIDAAGRVVI